MTQDLIPVDEFRLGTGRVIRSARDIFLDTWEEELDRAERQSALPKQLKPDLIEGFSEEMIKHLCGALADEGGFCYFIEHIFPESYPDGVPTTEGYKPFQLNWHHKLWAMDAEKYLRLVAMAPRYHLKSTILGYAYVMWRLWKTPTHFGLYISFREELASEHLMNIKQLIGNNKYYTNFRDRKPMSESELNYATSKSTTYRVVGSGIFTAKRGLHPHFCICDDILPDSEELLTPSDLRKVEIHFNAEVQNLPVQGGQLFVIGTPQDPQDILYKLKDPMRRFHWRALPAEHGYYGRGWTNEVYTDEITGATVSMDEWLVQTEGLEKYTALWQDMYPKDWLDQRRAEIGDKDYAVEFLMEPKITLHSFLTDEQIEQCVDPSLINYGMRYYVHDSAVEEEYDPGRKVVVAGLDPGKRRHPSHYCAFVRTGPIGNDTLTQIASVWLDQMEYNDQVPRFNELNNNLEVDLMQYDNTRGELEERDLDEDICEPITYTLRLKAQQARALERRLSEGSIKLLNDPRQKRSMLAVKGDLKAQETPDGHGDAFFSLMAAVDAAGKVEMHRGRDLIRILEF